MALGCPGGGGLICRAWAIRIVYTVYLEVILLKDIWYALFSFS
jgi:hypothetical protein